MITDKQTKHFCKDCKHCRLIQDYQGGWPFRCAVTGKAVNRYKVICDTERDRRLQTGEVSARKLPWYMVYIENTSLSRKPG